MGPNWKALAPHRPLDPGAPEYVRPPSGYAERIAGLVAAGTSTVLVGGPVGVGKSTELARIATLLQDIRVACLVGVDRHENIRLLTPDQLLLRIAGKLVAVAISALNLTVSPSLAEPLIEAGVLSRQFEHGIQSGVVSYEASPLSLARAAIGEVARRSRQGHVALVLDGLEKLPESPQAHDVLATLAQLGDEVDLVTVVPWFVAFGTTEDAIRPGALFAPLPAPVVEGPAGAPGRQFLCDILTARLGVPREILRANEDASRGVLTGSKPGRAVVLAAVQASGGLPRNFLQIMADAAKYAQIRRGDDWPNEQDLADAVADQRDSFRRVLLPGDTDAIRRVDGTDGREMDLGRKIRLLARGVILERQRDGQWVMDVHPLVRPLLGGSSGA